MKPILYFFLFATAVQAIAQNEAALATNRQLAPKQTSNLDSQDVRYLPLFGSKQKLQEQIDKSLSFIQDCERSFPSKQEASKFFVERGWEYLYEGLLDTATYRFNLAYLLNPDNIDVYWGLGSISYQRGNFEQSTALLRRGLLIAPENSILMVDIATVQIACFKLKKECGDLDEAVEMLEKAVQIDSSNANAWLKSSVAAFEQEKYDKAWEFLHKCRMLDLGMVDLGFVQDLIQKKEDPLGVFKK